MEIIYKVFEVVLALYFVYLLIRFLKCRFNKCDLK